MKNNLDLRLVNLGGDLPMIGVSKVFKPISLMIILITLRSRRMEMMANRARVPV